MRIWTLIAILFYLPPAFAQKADTVKTTVIIIDDNGNTAPYKGPKRKYPKNAVKVGLFRPVYGEAPIYYDRELADFFSIQANVGLTFRNLYYDLERIFFGGGGSDEHLYTFYEHRKTGIGVCTGIEPRFFFAGDGFEGWFIGFPVQYAIHNYKANTFNLDGTYSNETIKEKMKSIYFSINFGDQVHFDKVVLDGYFGIGLWHRTETRLSGNEFNPVNDLVDSKRIKLYYTVGLSLGGLF
jgi:hypothetical protein